MDDKNLIILMTTDTVGGVWNYSLELCRALQKYDVEVHLISLGGFPSKGQMKDLEPIDNIKLYPTRYKLEWMEHSERDIDRIEEKVYQLCKIIKPDILHFNNYIKSSRFFGIPQITVYHSCVQTWWQAVKGEKAPKEWDGYLELIENALNSSDLVVFPTKAIQYAAMSVHRCHSKTKIIPNGRDLPIHGDAQKEKIIMCMGRLWDDAKNLSLLCSIADQLPWPIYVAGDSATPGSTEKMDIEKVRFLGKLNTEELCYWLERTEIYINPALYEPFGLAALEAAKAGCALALSRLDTLQEVWKDNALYFNPNDENELLDNVLQLIENEDTRHLYQQRATQRASRFNGESFGKSYHDTYQSLIEDDGVQSKSKSAV